VKGGVFPEIHVKPPAENQKNPIWHFAGVYRFIHVSSTVLKRAPKRAEILGNKACKSARKTVAGFQFGSGRRNDGMPVHFRGQAQTISINWRIL